MVRIPETPAFPMHVQLPSQCLPFPHRDQLKPPVKLDGVQPAHGADAAVALENMLAQVTGIGP